MQQKLQVVETTLKEGEARAEKAKTESKKLEDRLEKDGKDGSRKMARCKG